MDRINKTFDHPYLQVFDPLKTRGSESMYILGGRPTPPPPSKKALEIRYRVEMHVHSPIFQGQLIEKKLDRQLL